MKIIMEEYGNRVAVEIPEGQDIHEVITWLTQLLMCIGYHPESVRDGILAKAEEYGNYDRAVDADCKEDNEDE